MYGQPEPLQAAPEHPSDVRRRVEYVRRLEAALKAYRDYGEHWCIKSHCEICAAEAALVKLFEETV